MIPNITPADQSRQVGSSGQSAFGCDDDSFIKPHDEIDVQTKLRALRFAGMVAPQLMDSEHAVPLFNAWRKILEHVIVIHGVCPGDGDEENEDTVTVFKFYQCDCCAIRN